VQLTVEHIVSAIAKARAEAEILAGEFPEYQTALLRFAQEALGRSMNSSPRFSRISHINDNRLLSRVRAAVTSIHGLRGNGNNSLFHFSSESAGGVFVAIQPSRRGVAEVSHGM